MYLSQRALEFLVETGEAINRCELVMATRRWPKPSS
jgi:hypothetical protein